MDDLLEWWLTACLDEVERTAREAAVDVDRWAQGNDDEQRWNLDPAMPDEAVHVMGEFIYVHRAAPHIALHDPRTVLARIEAERAILELHASTHLCPITPYAKSRVFTLDGLGWEAKLPCTTTRLLAYGHRFDHPGYRDEWAPDCVKETSA